MDPKYLRSARNMADLKRGRTDWFRVENKKESSKAEIYIYDEIGYVNITASDFVATLQQVQVSEIDLHINSPGGGIFDGIAIYNALRQHKAKVTTYVDSLAASIASVIAMAGDRIVMAKFSQMMVHEGRCGMALGLTASELDELSGLVRRQTDNIASIYAERTGGTTAEWRKLMSAETWFSDVEAVEAGLADEVMGSEGNTTNSFDLSIFTYPGRSNAPEPLIAKAEKPQVEDVEDDPWAIDLDTFYGRNGGTK